jgi:glucan phosphoethanolaminetransferase (alkaline phosphatase superfamily)
MGEKGGDKMEKPNFWDRMVLMCAIIMFLVMAVLTINAALGLHVVEDAIRSPLGIAIAFVFFLFSLVSLLLARRK